MDTSDEWIRRRTGIERDEIDYVIFATMTPDFYMPGSGTIFQHKLGLPRVPSLDKGIRQQYSLSRPRRAVRRRRRGVRDRRG